MWIAIPVLIVVFTATLTPPNARTIGTDQKSSQLRLVTTIVKERYCSDEGTRFLEWTLNLKYTNDGSEPILLDKYSRVFRTQVSTSL